MKFIDKRVKITCILLPLVTEETVLS